MYVCMFRLFVHKCTPLYVLVLFLRLPSVCGRGRQLWPDIRVGAMAYLLKGPSTTENKPRIERMHISKYMLGHMFYVRLCM
jgi:hypothetical protein